MFDWMVWTTPVAVFFIGIAILLTGMTWWEIRSPNIARKGWLPMVTTRGDRLFIGLLGSAYIHLGFVGLTGWFAEWFSLLREPHIWWASPIALLWMVVLMRKG